MLEAASFEILGRDEELAVLESFFSGATVRALVLEGEPGIGKTTLWRAALEMANGLGQRVLAGRTAGAEAQFSLSGLGDLLDGVPRDAFGELPAIQRRALTVALAEEDVAAEGLNGRVLGAAFLGLMRMLAEERPLVIAVDDLQWLDAASASVLLFAFRRLRDADARLLVSCRGEPGAPLPFACEQALVEEIARLAVGPLSKGAIHRLIGQRLGVNLPLTSLSAVYETSGGNPFFALELARAGTNAHADGLIRLPRNLELLVRERLQRLPVATREALAFASALSDPTFEVLDRVGVAGALEPAIDGGVIELEEGHIHFDHPLLAAAAWNAIGPKRKREIHRALSEAVEDEEQHARHLALATSGPDGDVALALERAAESAHRRAAPTAAAELFELARRLTPPDDDALWARLTERASAMHYEAGEWDRPRELAREALDRLPAGPERAAILLIACEMRPGQIDLARQALDEAGEGATRVRGLIGLCEQLALLDRNREADAVAAEACDLANRLGRRDLLGVCLIYRGAMGMKAERAGARLDLSAAGELERELGNLPTTLHDSYATWSALACEFCGDSEAARPLLEKQIRIAHECGDERNYCLIVTDLIQLEIDAGNWGRARALAEECRDLAGITGYTEGNGDYTRMLGLIAAREGDLEVARELIAESFAFFARVSDRGYETLAHGAMLFVRLCERDATVIGEEVDRFHEWLQTLPCDTVDASWQTCTQGDEIEALVVSGRTETARRRIDEVRRLGKKRPLAALPGLGRSRRWTSTRRRGRSRRRPGCTRVRSSPPRQAALSCPSSARAHCSPTARCSGAKRSGELRARL